MSKTILRVDGEVRSPRAFTFEDLSAIDEQYQIRDVSHIEPTRAGVGLWLEGILQSVQADSSAAFLGLHSSSDDFHASIPLAEVRERGFFIYRLHDGPLPSDKGGPVRFFIRDHASCRSEEVDECANVKFVDHVELTAQKGFDNRPEDEVDHAKLHGGER